MYKSALEPLFHTIAVISKFVHKLIILRVCTRRAVRVRDRRVPVLAMLARRVRADEREPVAVSVRTGLQRADVRTRHQRVHVVAVHQRPLLHSLSQHVHVHMLRRLLRPQLRAPVQRVLEQSVLQRRRVRRHHTPAVHLPVSGRPDGHQLSDGGEQLRLAAVPQRRRLLAAQSRRRLCVHVSVRLHGRSLSAARILLSDQSDLLSQRRHVQRDAGVQCHVLVSAWLLWHALRVHDQSVLAKSVQCQRLVQQHRRK